MDEQVNSIPVWVGSDGKTHLIADMPSRYIWNCLNKLNTQLKNKPAPAVYMGDSEYAAEAVEQENRLNDELEQRILEKVSQFEAELRKRGELPS